MKLQIFAILYLIMCSIAAVCYFVGYNHGKAEKRDRKRRVKELKDQSYNGENFWPAYEPAEKRTAPKG